MSHQKFTACIEACHACIVACSHCATSCLQEPDVSKMVQCITQDIDCAEMCALAVAAMSRGSAHAQAICNLCATICKACGDECAKHPMEHCQHCAKACHRCAEEWLNMATPD
jgi:hypothetical protein